MLFKIPQILSGLWILLQRHSKMQLLRLLPVDMEAPLVAVITSPPSSHM